MGMKLVFSFIYFRDISFLDILVLVNCLKNTVESKLTSINRRFHRVFPLVNLWMSYQFRNLDIPEESDLK